MAEIKDADGRHKFFEDRIGTALGAKGSKHAANFLKLISSEECNRQLMDFMNVPEVVRVFVADGPKDLICFDVPPPNQKKKMVYFLKLQKVALTTENINEVSSRAQDRTQCFLPSVLVPDGPLAGSCPTATALPASSFPVTLLRPLCCRW